MLTMIALSLKKFVCISVYVSNFLSLPGFHANMACRYRRPYDIVPFAFRTHAHSTGRYSLEAIFPRLIHLSFWKDENSGFVETTKINSKVFALFSGRKSLFP